MYESPDQEEPEFDAKGIETVRRDGCPAVAKVSRSCLLCYPCQWSVSLSFLLSFCTPVHVFFLFVSLLYTACHFMCVCLSLSFLHCFLFFFPSFLLFFSLFHLFFVFLAPDYNISSYFFPTIHSFSFLHSFFFSHYFSSSFYVFLAPDHIISSSSFPGIHFL